MFENVKCRHFSKLLHWYLTRNSKWEEKRIKRLIIIIIERFGRGLGVIRRRRDVSGVQHVGKNARRVVSGLAADRRTQTSFWPCGVRMGNDERRVYREMAGLLPETCPLSWITQPAWFRPRHGGSGAFVAASSKIPSLPLPSRRTPVGFARRPPSTTFTHRDEVPKNPACFMVDSMSTRREVHTTLERSSR